MALLFPPPGYQEVLMIVMILIEMPILLFAIVTYKRFTKGDYKKFLLYYLVAGTLVVFSTFIRVYGLFNSVDPSIFRTIDHGLYILALISCMLAFKHTNKMSEAIKRIRGLKK